ncbi:glycine cleavage T C-terminal barrel domain-containing protein [Gammaproteobacteria bacterium]|nr:glycine cleavage T C-terminal barrel domain-containing protein [Gammaproteobacteria bacterium]MDC1132063.1 glycine cleavage T C-terminal barrel domain-containing protein [Gammaproteobacteria bacterium]
MYNTAKVVFSPRVRKSPFFQSTIKHGAKAFTVYNHMYLPVSFENTIADYNNLLQGVQLWDVGVERQVQIKGPDAASLIQFLTPRNIKKCSVGQAMYAPLLDFQGGFLNDPVMLKLAEDFYWLSIADGDSLLWVEAIAKGYNFNVEVEEPDVSPLQVQGPNSAKLMTKVFGEWVDDLGFYRFKEVTHDGIPMVIARMGYSRELCYEIFLQDYSKGNELWEILWQAGQELNISPGGPNIIFRLEGGILSYLADFDRTNNPYEVGLDWMIDLNQEDDFIGKEALRKISQRGLTKKLMGAEIKGDPIENSNEDYLPVLIDGKRVGTMTAMVFSPRLQKNIAYVFLEIEHAKVGQEILISNSDQSLEAVVVDLPWFDRAKK